MRDKINYANTTATLALIVALGGTSYAAFTLPRDSVGHRQLRAGAVRSAEVKNGALQVADLSGAARKSLRGAQGPAGATGPAGPAAAQYWAVVKASGEFAGGNASGGGTAGSVGRYNVAFARSLAGCAITATLGASDTTTTVPGRITVTTNADGSAGVQTYDAAGGAADLPFHLIASC